MSFSPTVDNVLSIYNNSSAESLRTGLSWYRDAHNFAKTLDPKNVARAAGIIAALSPQSEWENNKNKAAQLYRQNGIVTLDSEGKVGKGNGIGLPDAVKKAIRIFHGEDPLDVLKGDKVTAFYRTILNPTGDIDPVIDRHAFDIAVGERTDDKTRSRLSRKGVYDEFANVYRDAARAAGIGSAQMQAVTWVAWREILGIV